MRAGGLFLPGFPYQGAAVLEANGRGVERAVALAFILNVGDGLHK
jgi:hypothetical protein